MKKGPHDDGGKEIFSHGKEIRSHGKEIFSREAA
jgi:hypothetical protein